MSDQLDKVQATELAVALGGDQDAFRNLIDPYYRELHVHCYRLLGSIHDAEDAMQETLLRAWRHLATFERRSSFRAWLYRIATNVCLTWRSRRARELPPIPPAIAEAVAASTEPFSNLSPYPDALLDDPLRVPHGPLREPQDPLRVPHGPLREPQDPLRAPHGPLREPQELEAESGNPVTALDLRESVQLAFLAAVQLLPPRQRAVLLLRDVLGFSAAEVAELLDSTTVSVNSALQRARSTLDQQRSAGRLQSGRPVTSDATEQRLVQRYLQAWDAADVHGLAGLLTADAVLTMPPLPLRYTGREAITEFLMRVPATSGAFQRVTLVPTHANRQPALAAYRFDATSGTRRAWCVFVLTLEGEAIAELTAFLDPTLFPVFGLPMDLEASLG